MRVQAKYKDYTGLYAYKKHSYNSYKMIMRTLLLLTVVIIDSN